MPLLHILTDRGSVYCGEVEQHDYQLYLAVNDIDHTRTKAQSPQTNGICERFHKTILNEFAYSTQSEQPFQLIVNAAEKSAAAAADCRQLFTMMCRRGELSGRQRGAAVGRFRRFSCHGFALSQQVL